MNLVERVWAMKKWMGLLLVVALLLAACGGSEEVESTAPAAAVASAQEAIAATLEIAMGDLYYGASRDEGQNPQVWTVNSGEVVELQMDNQGGLQHNWAIVKPGVEVPAPFVPDNNSDLILYEAGLVDPGEKESHVFTAPATGEYTVICTVAGHYPSMQGKLIVQ